MNFRTVYHVEPFERKISYNHKLLFLGSCFAENISDYFERSKFQVVKNPFGILYHPLALERLVDLALDPDYNPEFNSFQFNDIWSSFEAHSSLSSSSKKELVNNLMRAKIEAEKALKNSDFVFMSLGTAWVYEHLAQNKVVSNCHKMPQKEFNKRILKLSEVSGSLNTIVRNLSTINPNAELIFTLSPVRHLKDGFVENQLSKSTLHLAIHELVQNYDKIRYFPSYELLLDDLRDYRFYDQDMVHPNRQALDYIWSQIKNVFFNEEARKTLKLVESINTRLNHRFFNPESKASKEFKKKTKQRIEGLTKIHPQIKF